MASQLFLLPFRPALNANAIAVPGARLHFYASGTSTPQAVYSDEALTTPLSNPVTANAAGAWPSIYVDQELTYRVVVKDAGGNALPNGETDPYIPGVVDALAPEIAENAAASIGAATILSNYTLGIRYSSAADGVDPVVGVADGRSYEVLDGGRITGWANDGGVADGPKYEILTLATFAAANLARGAVVTEPPYNADATGTVNAVAAFTAMLSAAETVRAPSGTFKLDASVTVGGSLSWRNEAVYTGVGVISSATDFSGFNYSADFKKVRFVEGRGSAASPVTDKDAVGVFSKHSNHAGVASAQNPAVVGQHYKWSTTALTVAQAGFFESIDKAGNGAGRTDFVEGVRAHGIAMGAGAYGVVALGQVGDGVTAGNGKYAVGVESEVIRSPGADAANPVSWVSSNNLDACYMATVRYGSSPMAGFIHNPFSTIPVQCGFLVGNSFAAQGVNKSLVTHSAFCTIESDVPYALFARNVSYAVVSAPNNIAIIRAVNAAGSAEHNLLSYGSDNTVTLGAEAAGARIPGNVIFTPPASSSPGENGELVIQATSNTSLTFKLKGSDGVIRSASLTLS